jgi:hypothetical protein
MKKQPINELDLDSLKTKGRAFLNRSKAAVGSAVGDNRSKGRLSVRLIADNIMKMWQRFEGVHDLKNTTAPDVMKFLDRYFGNAVPTDELRQIIVQNGGNLPSPQPAAQPLAPVPSATAPGVGTPVPTPAPTPAPVTPAAASAPRPVTSTPTAQTPSQPPPAPRTAAPATAAPTPAAVPQAAVRPVKVDGRTQEQQINGEAVRLAHAQANGDPNKIRITPAILAQARANVAQRGTIPGAIDHITNLLRADNPNPTQIMLSLKSLSDAAHGTREQGAVKQFIQNLLAEPAIIRKVPALGKVHLESRYPIGLALLEATLAVLKYSQLDAIFVDVARAVIHSGKTANVIGKTSASSPTPTPPPVPTATPPSAKPTFASLGSKLLTATDFQIGVKNKISPSVRTKLAAYITATEAVLKANRRLTVDDLCKQLRHNYHTGRPGAVNLDDKAYQKPFETLLMKVLTP